MFFTFRKLQSKRRNLGKKCGRGREIFFVILNINIFGGKQFMKGFQLRPRNIKRISDLVK